MSQQQLSKFVSPVTQPLDDMHTHLSNLSTSYRDVNTKLKTHLNSLTTGTQGFQGSGANTFSSLVDYYTGAVEKHCQGLDSGASAAKSCSTQVTNAVDTASSSSLDATIVTHVLSQLTLDDIILHGGSAIDPIIQDMQKTWNQMQNTWSDLQKTWANENKTQNDSNAANNQALHDLFSFNFGGFWNDNVRIWNDTMQTFSDWGHEAGDYVQLGGQGLHLLWDAIQLVGQVLKQWAEDIYQAVKNCLSSIGSIVTTAVQDINTFISGIVKDEQRLVDDVQKGDYTAAINEILNDFVNPELKMMGMQPLSQSQIEDMLPRGFWQWLKNLPTWVKVLLIVGVVALIVAALIWGAISGTRPDPKCEKKINAVQAQFPGVRRDVIHYLVCMEPAMTTQQVIDLFRYWTTHGMSQQDINNLIDRLRTLNLPANYNQPSREQIIAFLRTRQNDIPDIWQKYQQIQHIPNADFILHDMIIGPDTKYRGSYFQLNWVVVHRNDVSQIEYFGADGRQGADALLTNGNLVDTKSYIWANQAFLLRIGQPQREIADQLNRYMTDANFVGRPVRYVFNSDGGRIPASIARVFTAARARGLNVTVEYWPNPNPPQIVP